jgi:hypothetical protein
MTITKSRTKFKTKFELDMLIFRKPKPHTIYTLWDVENDCILETWIKPYLKADEVKEDLDNLGFSLEEGYEFRAISSAITFDKMAFHIFHDRKDLQLKL